MNTQCFSMVWDRGLRSKSHASKKTYMNTSGVSVFLFARRTFAMGPRLAQALKNQENSMLFITVYTKIKKTLWFSSLFGAPDRARRALRAPRRPPQQSQKVMKTQCCFFNTFCGKAMKTLVFPWFGSVASESKVMNPNKYVKTFCFSTFFLRDGLLRWGHAPKPLKHLVFS